MMSNAARESKMPFDVPKGIEEALGWIAGALGALALGTSTLWRKVKSDHAAVATANTQIEKADAETDVIALLREEVARLAKSNQELQATVAQLRRELLEVQRHNTHLLTLLEQLDGYKKGSGTSQ